MIKINETYNLTDFGKYLKKLRKQGKLTQTDIRTINGINPKTIRSLEYGETIPTLDTLEKLSNIYKVDLVKSLENFRYDNHEILAKIYREIDYISLTDDLNSIQDKIEEIKQLSNNADNTYLSRKIKQLYYFSEITKIKNNLDTNSMKIAEIYCMETIRVTHPRFSIENIDNYYLDLLELRILVSLSFFFLRLGKPKEGLIMITSVINLIKEQSKTNNEAYVLLTHAYFVKSYILFLDSKHLEVIETCEIAIEISQNNYITKFLPNLYFRKGISEFRIKDQNYQSSLKSSLDMLQALNMLDLRKKYIKVLKDNYQIELS